MAVNVEPQGKVRFKITYEELLQRHLDIYQHIIHVNLDQVIDKLGCFEYKKSSEMVLYPLNYYNKKLIGIESKTKQERMAQLVTH